MSRVLGVNATSGTLWFVLAVDGVLENPDPISFELARGKTRADALRSGLDELASFLARNQLNVVALAVSRQKIKSLLGLKGRGNTRQFVEEHIPSPLAPYWLKKRDVAAMADLACS